MTRLSEVCALHGTDGCEWTQLMGELRRLWPESVAAWEQEADMGLTEALREAGYKPEANQDEDFPALKGEYRATVVALRPEVNRDTQEKDRYHLQLRITETLYGDRGEGRLLMRNYRIAGTNFDKSPVTDEQKLKALQGLLNDAFTMGVTLNTSSDEALEASFAQVIDKECFVRAWHFSPEGEDRKIQQFVIKQQKDLKKGAERGRTAKAPF